jgi:hypothetical protein
MAWSAFAESDPKCSFGDNNRTLVTPNVILNCLHELRDTGDDEGIKEEIEIVISRLESLPVDMCVDLEN